MILVEDKIKAAFQPNQMEDYLSRGERGKKNGKWKDYSVVVFAPSYRSISVPDRVSVLRFEEAARQLVETAQSDRLIYRAEFLVRAAQPNIVVSETENPFLTEWWNAVDRMAKREFSEFFIFDRQRFPKTTYINLKCADMPRYLRLDLKGSQGEVALAFIGFPPQALQSIISQIESKVGEVHHKRGQDPVLRLAGLQKFQISDGLEVIEGSVRIAYQAAYDLLNFWRTNRAEFDNLAAQIANKP
jgi:hypothetical protein